MVGMIYLDANATSPILPAASAAFHAALAANFGNPSSTHAVGLRARALLDATRATARRVLKAHTGRLLFTSGATEGIQTAVLSALVALKQRGQSGGLLLYGATEHKAVPQALAHWNAILGTGCELRALPVDEYGRHRLDILRTLAPQARLVCTMAANNETGAVSDLAGIAAAIEGSGALWMVDGVQALGKLPLALSITTIDYAPFSGHKLYAPKGIGLLYVRDGAPFTPLIVGGGQEEGQRSGTENMAGIAALGAVLQALEDGHTFRDHATLVRYRDRLAAALRDAFPGLAFNMPFGQALPTTLNFSVAGLASSDIVDLFDAAGIQVSAGSACSAAKAAPSYVLQAMAVPDARAATAVRLSFGPAVDDAFIDAACARIAHCGRALADHPPAAVNTAAQEDMEPAPSLDATQLAAFFAEHPQAQLVDVREAYEHAAGAPSLGGRAPHSVPLSRHAAAIPGWLAAQDHAIVFVCRSGKRSARAAAALRHLGRIQVYHLAGGYALAGEP
jgi:cysteine sulfinate desulfinase/cysteine desulfurase-like protein/rhodanese-related sulfurtransferase